MIATSIAFLRSTLGAYVVCAVVALVALGGWGHARYSAGYKAGKAATIEEYRKAYVKAQADILRRQKTASKVTQQVRAQGEKEQTRIVTQYRTLKEQVPVYVTPKADAACRVSSGAVRLYNAAASGAPKASLPRPAGGSLDAPSDVALSTLLGLTVENFGIAYSWRQEAMTWREWYVAQRAKWERE